MSENFKVEATTGREEWTGQYGPMITYKLLVNGGVEVDLNEKPETAAPQVGDEIWGHLEDGKYRPRVKKDKKEGGSWSDSGGDDLGPVIHRQVALKILAPTINAERVLSDEVKMIAKEIETFIGEAAGSPAPAATNGGSPSLGGTFDSSGISTQLEAEGINSAAAAVIVDYMLQEMSVEDQNAAMDLLGKEESRAAASTRLKERTEKALGQPLPDQAADDDIPF